MISFVLLLVPLHELNNILIESDSAQSPDAAQAVTSV